MEGAGETERRMEKSLQNPSFFLPLTFSTLSLSPLYTVAFLFYLIYPL